MRWSTSFLLFFLLFSFGIAHAITINSCGTYNLDGGTHTITPITDNSLSLGDVCITINPGPANEDLAIIDCGGSTIDVSGIAINISRSNVILENCTLITDGHWSLQFGHNKENFSIQNLIVNSSTTGAIALYGTRNATFNNISVIGTDQNPSGVGTCGYSDLFCFNSVGMNSVGNITIENISAKFKHHVFRFSGQNAENIRIRNISVVGIGLLVETNKFVSGKNWFFDGITVDSSQDQLIIPAAFSWYYAGLWEMLEFNNVNGLTLKNVYWYYPQRFSFIYPCPSFSDLNISILDIFDSSNVVVRNFTIDGGSNHLLFEVNSSCHFESEQLSTYDKTAGFLRLANVENASVSDVTFKNIWIIMRQKFENITNTTAWKAMPMRWFFILTDGKTNITYSNITLENIEYVWKVIGKNLTLNLTNIEVLAGGGSSVGTATVGDKIFGKSIFLNNISIISEIFGNAYSSSAIQPTPEERSENITINETKLSPGQYLSFVIDGISHNEFNISGDERTIIHLFTGAKNITTKDVTSVFSPFPGLYLPHVLFGYGMTGAGGAVVSYNNITADMGSVGIFMIGGPGTEEVTIEESLNTPMATFGAWYKNSGAIMQDNNITSEIRSATLIVNYSNIRVLGELNQTLGLGGISIGGCFGAGGSNEYHETMNMSKVLYNIENVEANVVNLREEGKAANQTSLEVNNITVGDLMISGNYTGNLSLRNATSPGGEPKSGIGKYMNITNVSGEGAITIKIHYSDSDVAGLDESSLKIWRWNGSDWLEVPSSVNPGANYVSAYLNNFSIFTILGDPPPSGGGNVGGGTETTSLSVSPSSVECYDEVLISTEANADVSIELNGEIVSSGSADENGEYVFVPTKPGNYTITAEKTGKDPSTTNLEAIPRDLILTPSSSTVNVGDDFVVVATSYGEKVEEVKIIFDNKEKYTNEDGAVTFTAENPGSFVIYGEKDGYKTAQTEISVIELPTLSLEIPSDIIEGESFEVLVISEGVPVEGAKVVVEGIGTFYTDDEGKVTLIVDEAGDYDITATKEGYSSASGSFSVGSSEETKEEVQEEKQEEESGEKISGGGEVISHGEEEKKEKEKEERKIPERELGKEKEKKKILGIYEEDASKLFLLVVLLLLVIGYFYFRGGGRNGGNPTGKEKGVGRTPGSLPLSEIDFVKEVEKEHFENERKEF